MITRVREAWDEALQSRSSGHMSVVLIVYALLSTLAVWGDQAALSEPTKISWAVGVGLCTASLDAALSTWLPSDGGVES